MKKLTFLLSFLLLGSLAFSQNSKYKETMIRLVGEVSSNPYGTLLQPVANKLERVAAAESGQWLPNYWVAYCYIQDSFLKQDPAERDQLLAVADKFLKKAEELKAEPNAEIEVLKASWASAKLSVDGASRYMEYGGKFENALTKAGKLDPGNPRVDYLRGMSAFYTPENFGGGKNVAKPLFEKALQKFDNFEAETAYHPSWGKVESQYFLSQCN